MTTFGLIDQCSFNWLKPLVKTGGGFDRPALDKTIGLKWVKPYNLISFNAKMCL